MTGPQLIEPEILGSQVSFRLGDLAPREQISVLYRVRIEAGARLGQQADPAIGWPSNNALCDQLG